VALATELSLVAGVDGGPDPQDIRDLAQRILRGEVTAPL
jgi:hypothetical protein